MAKRRITWTKNGTPFFGGIDSPDAPHGGRDDLHFVIRKNKRGYSVEDARDAVTTEGTKNHWFSEWVGGFRKIGDAKRFAEQLVAGVSFKAALLATNPELAGCYSDADFDRYDPALKTEHDVDKAEAHFRSKMVCTPTEAELTNAVYRKFGGTGRTTRLVLALLGRIETRPEKVAFAV